MFKNILITFILAILPIISFAEDNQECFYRCKAEILDVEECINLERKIWDTSDLSDYQLTRICKFMIVDEVNNCRVFCNSVSSRMNRAIKFYDSNIKNFPDTN